MAAVLFMNQNYKTKEKTPEYLTCCVQFGCICISTGLFLERRHFNAIKYFIAVAHQ